MDESKLNLAKQFLALIPYAARLSIRLESVDEGAVELSMPYDPRLVGDPATGVIHGGAVFSLLDTAGGAVAMTLPANPGAAATIDLRIDYMRPATPGQRLRARAECYHSTRSVAFVRATATDDDTDRPVAIATGAFSFEHAPAARP